MLLCSPRMNARSPARSLALAVAAAVVAAYLAYRLVAPAAGPAPAPSAAPPASGASVPRLDPARVALTFAGKAHVAGVAVDARGNVFVAGAFSGTLDLGGGPLVSAGDDDVFLLALDPAGKHRWSKAFGGPGMQAAAAVAVGPRGEVVVAGTLDQSADFGGGALVSAGLIDVFVAVLDASGRHLWSKRFGDAAEQEASAVAVGADGSVVLAGSYEGTLDFGGGPLPSAGGDDVYLARLDAAGNHLWSKRFGDARAQKGRAVAVGEDGGVVLAGLLEGTADFGGGPLEAVEAYDLFLARFDAGGRHLASRRFPGGRGARVDPRAMAVARGGLLTLAGVARGPVDLGAGLLAPAGDDDAFVVQLDGAGQTRFARRFGGGGTLDPRAVAALPGGAVAVAGRLDGTVALGGRALASAGRDDAGVFVLDAAGDVVEARRFGDPARQGATALAAGPAGLWMAGDFEGTVDFGAGPQRGPGVFVTLFAAR
jgi:hypothetical protein